MEIEGILLAKQEIINCVADGRMGVNTSRILNELLNEQLKKTLALRT